LLFAVVIVLQFAPALSGILTGRIDAGDPTDASGNAIGQVIAVAAFLGSIFLARLSNVPVQRVVVAALPLVPMLCWLFISTGWSDHPDLTLKRASRLTVEVSTIIMLASSAPSTTSILRSLFRVFVFINVLDIVSMSAPGISNTPIGFAGIHFHKNTAGLFFFLAIPVFVIGIFDRAVSGFRGIAIFAFFTASVMLAFTLSKSAVGTMLLTAALVALVRTLNLGQLSRVVLPAIYVLFAGCIVSLVLSYGIDDTVVLLFGDSKFTGRDQIWRYVLYLFEKNPLSGVGYGALWQTGPEIESMLKYTGATWVPNEGHNGYLDILGQAGYVGIGLLSVFLVVTWRRLTRYAGSSIRRAAIGYADYALYVFIGAIIYNVTESSFFRSGQGLWFMLVFISASVSDALARDRVAHAPKGGRPATMKPVPIG
jgi:O-antigen ligase